MSKCDFYKKIDFIKEAIHSITVQSVSETSSVMGDFTNSWSNLATMRAIIKPVKQFEKMQYNKMDSEVTHEIIVRYQSIFSNPLTSVKYRILFNNRQLEIKEAINMFEDNKFVKIIANEVQS
jgi:SPP1 family predicted phage head-tail adaptor